MTSEEIRAKCALFMGWARVDYNPERDSKLGPPFLPHYRKKLFICDVGAYRPDQKPEQAEMLKARLRELGYAYEIYYDPEGPDYAIEIGRPDGKGVALRNPTSEQAALAEAVANMEDSQ